MKRYKDTYVAKGSALLELLEFKSSDPEKAKENKKAIEKLYNETTLNYNNCYPEEDRKWFAERQQESFARLKASQTQISNQPVSEVKELTV